VCHLLYDLGTERERVPKVGSVFLVLGVLRSWLKLGIAVCGAVNKDEMKGSNKGSIATTRWLRPFGMEESQ
jgi:hypothetical protein